MTSRFTALPLESGESFVLESDHGDKRWVILVDGGQSKKEGAKNNGLYKAIREHCPEIKQVIDIALCTHQDHDHAGGFPAFINTWLAEGNAIGEFWLPGGWAGAVDLALKNPDQLVAVLKDGASAAVDRISAHDLREEGVFRSIQSKIYEICIEDSGRERSEGEVATSYDIGGGDLLELDRVVRAAKSWGFSDDEWVRIKSDLETGAIHDESLFDRAQAYGLGSGAAVIYEAPNTLGEHGYDVFRHTIREEDAKSSLARTLFLSSIETAETIRAIATVAVNFDIPVRWFDFSKFEKGSVPSGGITNFLQPLNAVEVRRTGRETDALSIFLKLTLTQQNVASLVFQRLESSSEPGVIFLGDSRLAFGVDQPDRDFDKYLVQPSRPIVYTAAHHGSRNNDRAYEVLEGWLPGLMGESISVRNGGVWNQTLGKFQHVKNRRCAQCHQCHGGDWSQLVQINSDGGVWCLASAKSIECGVPSRKRA